MDNLKTDYRNVKKGDTFIAIPNVVTDGHDFIEDAIKNGATKIICERGEYSVETIIVENTREYLNNYLYKNSYPKIKDMKLIGITGTNGKTTTSLLVYQMLQLMNQNIAYIGTFGFYYKDIRKKLRNTTPNVDILYELLIEAKENGCEYIVMEVSSHALDQNRIYGLEYDEVAFTNLTQDHLDYHKDLDTYKKAKQKLFQKTRGNKVAIINGDDPSFQDFLYSVNKNIVIGQNSEDMKIEEIELNSTHTNIKFTYQNRQYEATIKMVGKYNVYNFLTALLLVNQLGFPIEEILKTVEYLYAPDGRMEKIEYKMNSIFIDYAHTPDAVMNVLRSTEDYKKGKVITIIGCGGDRDRTKRPIMGSIAETYSDYVIFTNDNPRTEDENQIMKDIKSGLEKNNHEIILDRKEAIIKGIEMLTEQDILMILGKGHEDYQVIGTEKHHFSDKEVVLDYIETLKK